MTAAALPLEEFDRRVRQWAPGLSPRAVSALHVHYRSLVRWNERTSLVGPGTIEQAIDVHYGESLAALELLGEGEGRTLVDIGSGAGFPGFVLAAALPGLRCVLVEARERKWSFLKAVATEAGVAADCVLGTVDRSLPKGFPGRVHYVTLRALKLAPRAWQAVLGTLAPEGRVLIWSGEEDPDVPATLCLTRTLDLPRTRARRIRDFALLA